MSGTGSTFTQPTNVTGSQTTQNPLQPYYQSAPPQIAPTTSNFGVNSGFYTAQPGQSNFQLTPQYLQSGANTSTNVNVSPQQALSQFQSADALQNAQASNNLSNMLAAQGISGNDATSAIGTLQGQLAASQAPALASLIQNAQGLQLNQAQGNVNSGLQQALSNAGFGNTALNQTQNLGLSQALTNAGFGNTMNLANQGAGNAAISNSNQLGLGQSEFNAGAGNSANAQNLAAILGVNQGNQNAANTSGTNLAQLLTAAQTGDQNAVVSLLLAGLGGTQNLNQGGLSGLLNLNNQTNNQNNTNTANFWQSLLGLGAGMGGGGGAGGGAGAGDAAAAAAAAG